MRLLNLIMAALAAAFAIMAGLVVATLVAVVGSALLVFKRLKRPAVTAAPSRSSWNRARDPDVIDVTATEVAAERIAPPRS